MEREGKCLHLICLISSPQLLMVTSSNGREFLSTGTCSSCRTKSCPETTSPNTTWMLERRREKNKYRINLALEIATLTCPNAAQAAWYYNEIIYKTGHLETVIIIITTTTTLDIIIITSEQSRSSIRREDDERTKRVQVTAAETQRVQTF